MAYIDTGAYDKWRRAQEQARALDDYNTQKEAIDQKYENKGLGGFLGDIVGGIGKGIGDVGKGVFGLIGTGVASARDLVGGTVGGKGTEWNEGKETDAFKKWLNGTDDLQDAYAKTAGTSLNAATTLGSVAIPAAGAGTALGKVAAGTAVNTAAGALGGVADELQMQGKDASWEGATNRALSGAAAGLATGALGSKIGNANTALGSKVLNNKLATSTLGRGALTGAVGGAVGGGTSAALSGGDIESAALQGALTGAGTGAVQAGAMRALDIAAQDLKNSRANKAQKKLNDVSNVLSNEATADTGMPDYTKPKDWAGNELKLEKKGVVGGLGDKLENVAKGIKDQDVYNSLYSKTADKVINNNSIERLREIGFEPKDYGDAAKVSTAVNKFFDDVVGNSGAAITDVDLSTRLANPDVTFLNDNLQKAYTNEMNKLMTKLETGSKPGEYSVKDLLDQSRKLSSKAATEYRKGIDVNGNDNGNGRSDLGDAYMTASRELRSLADAGMDGLGDNYTRGQLTKMLENMGAPKKTIEYFSNFSDLSDGIRKTSLLEDARQMNKEISKTKVRRNATAGNSKNILNRVADKTGVTQVLDVVAEPIGRVTGAAAEKIGKGLQSADNAMRGNISGNTQTPKLDVQPMNATTQRALNNWIGRTIGQQQANRNVNALQQQAEYNNLNDQFNDILNSTDATTAAMGLDGSYGMNAGTGANSQIASQLADIQNGMQLALAAGDITSYNQLMSLYKDAYDIYEAQNKSTGSTLSTAEKNQIAKLQSAGTALDELEALYQKAGGGQGIIGGNIANFLGGLGLNSDVNTYNQLAQGLINQIGAAIGKTDSLNTEGEVQRALSLVPKITDDNQTAMNKLATLRSLLQTNTGTYNQLYQA